MQAALRSWYLQRLGITEWQSRAELLAQTAAPALELSALELSSVVEPVVEPFVEPVIGPVVVSVGVSVGVSVAAPVLSRQPSPVSPVPAPVAGSAALASTHDGGDSLQICWHSGSREGRLLVVQAAGRSLDSALLQAMLASIGLSWQNAGLAGVARPGDRAEPATAPVLLVLGQIAASSVLGSMAGLAALRGRVHAVRQQKLVVTYTPDELRRNPALKRLVWQDLRLLATALTSA